MSVLIDVYYTIVLAYFQIEELQYQSENLATRSWN